jgi:hypothetical protein
MSEPISTCLPPETVENLRKAEPFLGINKWNVRHVERVLSILDTLPPSSVVRADYELRWLLGLYDASPYGSELSRQGMYWTRKDVSRLTKVPELAYLYLFHANGRIRQCALERIEKGARSPFFLAAIALRLNDWAAPVRAAATRCADKVFPLTDPSIVEAAAYFLLAQRHEWRRWSAIETGPLDRVLQRPEVAALLVRKLANSNAGPVGRLLRSALRGPGFDQWLSKLALEARHPELRKVALQVLIQRSIRWPSHRERRWTDKSMGRYREAWVFASRPIESDMSVEFAMLTAARDRSAAVRRVAVVALLTHGRDLAGFDEAAAILIQDKNKVLRERTAYALQIS